ncbi:flagellar biosynthesis protein FlhB [Corticimicrobacter populi]|uniref:Flagellar biosynthetic protein FlhB n=1 Tax=Corticimicrobacter populi TaxID=2175229 RepID=A0A2V1K076_9BURK|nr:flagellar biosynthesis protein FlhB [Corticimicrobacter populi]PWF21202.1 flagellar biosynthetic protein FlhB [Corticimicrobacter populi]
MAEDSDLEKTEPASPRRLEKAREEGQVARSRELTTFLMLLGGVSTLWLGAGWMYQQLGSIYHRGLAFDQIVIADPGQMIVNAVYMFGLGLLAVAPVMGVLAVLAVLGSVAMGGLVISTKALEPKFSRMNPLSGLQRLVSMQSLVELFKAVGKSLLIGGVAAWVIWGNRDAMLDLIGAPVQAAIAKALDMVAISCIIVVATLLLIVAIDAPWQLFSHLKKLRMSKQDLKQEHKESEGDPQIKARIKQQQRAMSRRRMMSQVPMADVVVTNPLRFAVALRYQEGVNGAPTVIAKGSGLIAARIREIATEHKVPILEAPPLARALHKHVELDQEIPAALYTAVAEVLAWVFQLRTWRQHGKGAEPTAPRKLPVPTNLDPLASQPTESA